MKVIEKEHRVNLAKLVIALAENDPEATVRVMAEDLGVRTKHMDPYVLKKLATMFMDRDDLRVTEGLNPQLFMEKLEKLDPIVSVPDDYVMAFRVSLLLRGLSHALRYEISHAQAWESIAHQILKDDPK